MITEYGEHIKILSESIKRLLRRNAVTNLKKIVNKTHMADLSMVFRNLSLPNQIRLFDMIDDVEQQGILFSELDDYMLIDLIQAMNLDDVVTILESMARDDAADVIGKLPSDQSSIILDKMQKGSEEVEGLLKYDNETAGGIMVPDFIALKEDVTAKEAISSLQKEHVDVEMPFYLYVVDDQGRLTGVCSLRQLVVAAQEKQLKDFMFTDVVYVRTDMDQEEVAKIVARYDILAVPVVDDSNRLVGIVTVDDVIDIIRREATEDILKMAGAGEEFIETKSVMKSTRIRLPWLFASCLGGIFAFFIINGFEQSLKEFTFLAAFIPVIMGMGGNIGTQSSTIVVRGLATGNINTKEILAVVFKEFSVGFILGAVYGSLLGVVAHFSYSKIMLGVSVGLAVISSMSVAALVGSLAPMLFAKARIDPAVATGPFVTTAIDIISVFFYFKISTTLMGL